MVGPPGVAVASPRVTHLALLGASATHGLTGSLNSNRNRLRSGAISAEEFGERYDTLVEQFRSIRENPDSLDGYQDHTYRRWSSYVFGQVLDDLVRIDMPIFLGIASEDTQAQPFGADLVVNEFLRRGKRNLTYLNYVGYDHGFATGEGDEAELHQDVVLQDVLHWLTQSSP